MRQIPALRRSSIGRQSINMDKEKVLKTDRVFKGRGMEVRVDHVLTPSGRATTREVVRRQNAVVVLAVDRNEQILMVRQYRHSVGQELLELPAGGIEPGEGPSDSARRELQEETGFAPGRLRELGKWYAAPGYCTEFMHLFLATELTPSRLVAEDTDEIVVVRLAMDDCLDLIREGKIQDGKTIAGLLLYQCGRRL